MSDKRMSDEMFNELAASMREAVAISRGEMAPSRTFFVSALDVKEVRSRSKKSQREFAEMIGVGVGTLRNWEQGRRKPHGAALSLLKIVSANPEYAASILHS